MKNSPFFSVMICCYNSEKFINETINSIIDQTFTDWEIVLINDGSKDRTEKIVKEFINKGVIIIHRHKNDNDQYSKNLKILEEKNYGISKILFGVF